MGGGFPKWIASFLIGQPVFRRGEKRQLRLQLISTVRNGGLGREGIGTSMMMQLVDCTIDTSQFLRRERDECLLDERS